MSARGRTRRAQGFTLVELMVSLTIGGLAIGSMYSIGSTLTRQYHQQQQAANAMTSLRMAIEQVKRDIARAGFLATPNVGPAAPHVSLGCEAPVLYPWHVPAGSGSLAGISRFEDNVCDGASPCSNLNVAENVASGFTADRLTLFGNYETGAEYPYVEVVSPTQVAIGADSHAFQTDFTNWFISGSVTGAAAFDTALFNRAFAVGRLIRLRTTDGRYHFSTVAVGGVTPPTATTNVMLTLTRPIPPDCLGPADHGWIAPVSAIRYFPTNGPSAEADPLDNPFGPIVQLVREEVDPTNKVTALTLNDGSPFTNTRVVLDYLVSFNLGFVTKPADAVGAPDIYAPGVPNPSAAAVNANPEYVRAVRVELSVRTPDQDRTLPWNAGTCALLGCFRVWDDRPGAARVRTLRAEVFIPNIAYEGY